MTKTRLTGYDAILYAEERDLVLSKHADPVEGARENLSPDAAREIAAHDPSLIYLDIQPSVLTAEIDDDAICVRDSHGGVWYPDEEAEAEIRAASDPEARAVEIARTTPMRGTWHD